MMPINITITVEHDDPADYERRGRTRTFPCGANTLDYPTIVARALGEMSADLVDSIAASVAASARLRSQVREKE
jgi:hypothetical protein